MSSRNTVLEEAVVFLRFLYVLFRGLRGRGWERGKVISRVFFGVGFESGIFFVL